VLQRLLQKFFRLHDIVKTVDGQEQLYLRRYYIAETRWGNIFLHNICRSDDDPDPHDHPWNFLTIVLKGSYYDEAYDFLARDLSKQGGETYDASYGKKLGLLPWFNEQPGARERQGFSRRVRRFRPTYRKATHIHRVILNKPVWSLVFTGKTFRPWGFVKEDRWVFWRDYLNNWTGEAI
jgi:hypothetical protein